jgi:hypothetical protein
MKTHKPLSRKQKEIKTQKFLVREEIKKEESFFDRADERFANDVKDHFCEDGIVVCYTCDKHISRERIQLGHFLPRGFLKTRFDWRNCKPQCMTCNVLKGGNVEVFRERLVAEYGEEVVESLKKKDPDFRLTNKELEEIWKNGSKIGR